MSLKSEPDSILRCRIIRSEKRTKTLAIQIQNDGTVSMHVPFRTPVEEADLFFRQKEKWVRKKLDERALSLNKGKEGRSFLPGEQFPYLGEHYPLEVASSLDCGATLVLSCGKFLIRHDKVDIARDIFVTWYKQRAREKLEERVDHYGRQFNLHASGVTITSAMFRLGSCSPKDRISLAWRIILAPYPVIDYVILHELAHIKEKNHSRRFWNLLETMMPDYRRQRLWLKRERYALII